MLTDERKEWNATAYHAVSDPQFRWGLEVLARVHLRGDETVLDAGCGTGRITAKLAEQLPRGRVLACDLSENMVRGARDFLTPQFGQRVEVFAADMARLDLDAVADGIVSTAAFHWVHDHEALFASLFRALKPGGLLVAQCGGGANLAGLYARVAQLQKRSPFAEYFANWKAATYFATPAETTARLRNAGFEDADVYITPAPTPFADGNSFRAFISTVCLAKHLKELPAGLHTAFLDPLAAAAAQDDPPFTLDYQRLNIYARKP
jgi:trans-aconitate 2-methyltransferase